MVANKSTLTVAQGTFVTATNFDYTHEQTAYLFSKERIATNGIGYA